MKMKVTILNFEKKIKQLQYQWIFDISAYKQLIVFLSFNKKLFKKFKHLNLKISATTFVSATFLLVCFLSLKGKI